MTTQPPSPNPQWNPPQSNTPSDTPPPHAPIPLPPVYTPPPQEAAPATGHTGPNPAGPSQLRSNPTGSSRSRGRSLLVAAVTATALVAGSVGGAIGASLNNSESHQAARITASQPATQTKVDTSESGTSSKTVEPSSEIASGLTVAEVLDRVDKSVVAVTTEIVQRRGPYTATGSGAGTGIILSSDGEILTNAHVVSGASSVTISVTGDDGEVTEYPVTVVAADTSNDLALLQVTGNVNLPAATIGNSDLAKVGDDVIAVGNALALEGSMSVTRGIISALDRSITTGSDYSTTEMTGLIQTDAAISSGNSGGPLVNAAGEVIGINTAVASSSGSTQASNIGFVIPINQAMTIVKQLRNAEH